MPQSDQDLRSFGRRRGRKWSEAQVRLWREVGPALAIDLKGPAPVALATLFKPLVRETWLEIGFGGSEHLVAQAAANPDIGLIGCEPYEDGVLKAIAAIEARGLSNVRLHADDARTLLRWLPEASISRAFVLFPDPWPKKRQQKRRLVNRATLALLARVVRRGGELRIGTDIGDYVRSMMIEIEAEGSFAWQAQRPVDWRVRPPDWPMTRYEQKALREGRRCYYFRLTRRARDQ